MSKKMLLLVMLLVLLAAGATSGCRRVRLADTAGAGARDEARTVGLGEASSLKTSVRMAVGTLTLVAAEPSSTLALDATFTYPQASWKPKVDFSVEATHGTLSVAQPEVSGFPGISLGTIGEGDNTWRLKLAAGVPTDLSLQLGVGDSDVKLAGIDVTTLHVVSGVGKTKLDLTGPRTHDLKGSVESGVGQVNITVPSGVGVKLTGGAEGVGELTAPGFVKSDGALVNSAWAGSGPKMELDLTRGVGEIKVTSVD